MSDTRELQRRRFLAAAALDPARCVALAADASTRRYFRVACGAASVLLMDVPAGDSEFASFIAISKHLCGLGLSAPRVLQADLDSGLALIEDLGTLTYSSALEHGHDEAALYQLAVQALVALHRAPKALAIKLPAYDLPALLDEVELFARWYAPRARPKLDVDAFASRFNALWTDALSELALRRESLVLRDYHVDNLMLIESRQGYAACGLLDFQDAVIGAFAYDLVSLCQDARRDLAPGLEAQLVELYIASMPGLNVERFERDYWLLAAQRHAKVAGIFERLSQRDGKHGYLRHQARVLRLLERALERAGLHTLRDFLHHELPGWSRYEAAAELVSIETKAPHHV
jgi:aminoglycoside/choline kinase family phosphotransferase